MPHRVAESLDETHTAAIQLVSEYIVRACQQAIYDVAIDDTHDAEVRHDAISALRQILDDWREARRELRAELAGRARTFTQR